MTQLSRVRDLAGRPERPDHPTPINRSELEDPVEIRGLTYYRHRRWGRLTEHSRILDSDATMSLPDLPYIEDEGPDGERVNVVFRIIDDEVWQRLTAPRQTPKTKPARAVSALRGVWTFRGKPEVMVPGERGRAAGATSVDAMAYLVSGKGEGSGAQLLPGKPPATHPADMVARFEAKGIELLAPVVDDVPELIAFAPGGRINESERDALHRARRLIAAHLSGEPATCEGPDCSEPAVDVLWPSELVVCAGHTEPEAWR